MEEVENGKGVRIERVDDGEGVAAGRGRGWKGWRMEGVEDGRDGGWKG